MAFDCFSDKVALITGGTRGIGLAVAKILAENGCNLALVYRRDKKSASAAETQLAETGAKVITIRSNIADPEVIPSITEKIDKEFGRLDYFVSNAVFGVLKPAAEFDAKRFDACMDTNAKAYMLLAGECAKLMAPDGGAVPSPGQKRIVALTSLGSHKVIPGYAGIGAGKAAIEAITRYLAFELAQRGIGVNAVSGGLVDTDSMKAFEGEKKWLDAQIANTPMGRIGSADDIAKVVVWLLSDQSAWITGQVIVADGGLSLV